MKKDIKESDLRKDIAVASAWMVGMRWSIKAIGLVNIIILARLLSPDDFGVVAKSLLFVGFIEVLGEAGFKAALIRNMSATADHYNCAYTGQVLLGLLLTAIVVVLAPLAGDLFKDSRVSPAVSVLALSILFSSLQNIGTVEFRKFNEFNKEFKFGLYKRLFSFFITLYFVFTLRSYWALVIGLVSAEVIAIALSYWMHPFRPRIQFSHVREVWSYSLWIMLGSAGRYWGERADQFVIAGLGNTAGMGVYKVSAELAVMPTAEIIAPLSAALFPSYARLQENPQEFNKAFLNVAAVLGVIISSVSVGMALVAPELVLVLLGEKWVSGTVLLQWLTMAAGIWALSNMSFLVLGVLGEGRTYALQNWFRPILLIPFASLGFLYFGMEGAAAARLLVLCLLLPISLMPIFKLLPVTVLDLTGVLWRPFLAAGIMALTFVFIRPVVADLGLYVRLMALVGFGVFVFCAAMSGAWLIAGKPRGFETAFLRNARFR